MDDLGFALPDEEAAVVVASELIVKKPLDIVFNGPDGEIARLWWDCGLLHFEGDTDEAAKLFFNQVILQGKQE